MPFPTPFLTETRARSRDDVTVALEVDALPGNSPARILADANGGLAFETYEGIRQQAEQFLPDKAEKEFLLRWAAIYRLPVQLATFAEGIVTVTGLDARVVPAGQQFSADGVLYQSEEAVTVGTDPTPVPVRALTAGVAGNLAAGATMALTTAVSGVDAAAVVVAMAGGVDAESPESLRDRVVTRMSKPPMGGDADDYVAWAREVPGVTRAWCAPNEMGPGTVTMRFMMDTLRATLGGFPTSDDVAVVQAHIDMHRPVTVLDCFVFAPIPEPIDFTVSDLVRDTPATRAAITASVKAMLAERAAPARSEGGAHVPAQTIHREWVSAAILDAAGVENFELTMVDHVMPNNGAMGVLGTITYG